VLLVEAGAQVAGMVAQEDPAIRPLPRLKLTALRGVKILVPPGPGKRSSSKPPSLASWA